MSSRRKEVAAHSLRRRTVKSVGVGTAQGEGRHRHTMEASRPADAVGTPVANRLVTANLRGLAWGALLELPGQKTSMTTTEPTPEMIAFYERRTREHIERVRRCLTVMSLVTEYADELNERARIHDASKFGPEERTPYIWLTEFHRCRRAGEPFSYPAGMEERVRVAIDHHMTTNRHHPEFHSNPNDMTDVDLIEMVCDWTAMSQEFGQDGGSARGWADKMIGSRLRLNDDRRRFVYAMIDLLDSNLDRRT